MFHRILLFGLIGLSLASKIDPTLRELFKTVTIQNTFLTMKGGIDNVLQNIDKHYPYSFSNRTKRIKLIKADLESLAVTSQKGVLSILESHKANYTSFWISNQVLVHNATWELVELLEQDSEVAYIRQEEYYWITWSVPSSNTRTSRTSSVPWGIEKIQAPQAWGLHGGNKGEGVVIATIDSGALSTHEALRDQFRADKGWYDPYDHSSTPVDGNGHGTHVLGTIVGSKGIGVAPGGQWIACRGCYGNTCSQSAVVTCGQWILCPSRADGSDSDCDKAPQIVSSSWGGGQNVTSYLSVVNAWHSAGIIPIFKNGDVGMCGTSESPGDLENVIGVGSTNTGDGVSIFSSRGPARNGHLKPDITAPGEDIYTSWHTGDSVYNYTSGTRMANAHVAGVVALLLGRDPNLSYERVKGLLFNNTDRKLAYAGIPECGGLGADQFPNNIYGYGRLNARRSLQALIQGKAGKGPDSKLNSASDSRFAFCIHFGLLYFVFLF